MLTLQFFKSMMLLWFSYFAFIGCSGGSKVEPFHICDSGATASNGCDLCSCVNGQWSCPRKTCSDLNAKAGYIEIEPISFSLTIEDTTKSYTSSKARIWYAFQPADELPENKPLVVFYNGGPGSSTSAILFAYNTAYRSLDEAVNGGNPIGVNPHSWSRMANLLYIDARGTGFSYGLMNNPSNLSERSNEFNVRNFNTMFDAADTVRVILRFLATHSQIQKNPVILVGESYAGIRTTAALHLLLHYRDYAQPGSFYRDVSLADEIQTHFNQVFTDLVDQEMSPSIITQQFGHQVLAQALLTGKNQVAIRKEIFDSPDSPLLELAQETGTTFVPCSEQSGECNPLQNAYTFIGSINRDVYNVSKPAGWVLEKVAASAAKLTQAEILSEQLGIEVSTIDWIQASQRALAYRTGDPGQIQSVLSKWRSSTYTTKMETYLFELSLQQALSNPEDGNLPIRLGEVQRWDRYFMSLNDYIYLSFYSEDAYLFQIDPFNQRFGTLFLHNLLFVKTFVSQAAFDFMLYSLTIPKALALHTNIVSQCEHDTIPRPDIQRPGWLHVTYLPNVFDDQPEEDLHTIRFPHYEQSGHTISIDQPADLLQDVEDWFNTE